MINKTSAYLLLLLISLSSTTLAAKKRSFNYLDFQPHVGVSWQSTLFKPFFDFSIIQELGFTSVPYKWEKNTQGFGLDFGFTLSSDLRKNHFIGTKVNARFRYDYVYGGFEGWRGYEREIRSPLLDLGVGLMYQLKNRNNRDLIVEIGVTANQMGKFQLFDPSPDQTGEYYILSNLQYTSLNLGVGYDIIKLSDKFYIQSGLFINYIAKGHPAYEIRDFMTIGIKSAIRFKPGLATWKR